MGKSSKDNNKSNNAKKGKATITKKSAGGLDEIDSLFADKKQSHKELQQQISEEKEVAKQERKRRKQARLEEEADEFALRGSAGVGGAAAGGGNATASAALHGQAKKLSNLTYTRSDVEQLNGSTNKEVKNKWASDGLGGVFNGEGFTGRQDDGHRVFKAHLMNKKGFGESPDCPFDCDCCFI
mmetsp:Transcript_10826/g.23937  ORF Transcript_10826/g.23937 Transcript_10826/m.23937 type:complete len:183 (-) Transcript_10826:78-626(-)|eukprot:CAMPEP_0172323068 /NCGR_PEP_ID=MMETSP1058-20130122/47770_1 /TAXON_ID=83371 /ORGANISM="Detonula confervacea, Strain CCMP 353" /LENGTH=182 /DNA_ID=CAMNT_0013038985 /DNA_START=210 /DNA_END=758 /DNA_ORIENTATION=-